MVRRAPYSKVEKQNQIKTERVAGNGDVLFRGFECINPECDQFIKVEDEVLNSDYEIVCPKCSYTHTRDGRVKLYDFDLTVIQDEVKISMDTGIFAINHRDYIDEALRYKYCIVCNKLKPVEDFDRHSARNTKRQGECRLCKKSYNAIKNKTRIIDQHREAANKRRLLLELSDQKRLDIDTIIKRFGTKCFNCGMDLSEQSNNKWHLDHTLPIYYLWSLSTDNATLLCSECNGAKSNKWPSEFYDDSQLKKLSFMTGIEYKILAGEPFFNPEAITRLCDSNTIASLLTKYAKYENEVFLLRDRISNIQKIDIFDHADLNPAILERANSKKKDKAMEI